MSEKKQFLSTSSLTPGKMALIAVLSLVFIGVLVMNFSGSGSPKKSAHTSRASRRRPVRNQAAGTPKPQQADQKKSDEAPYEVDVKRWSQFSLGEIEAFNPFELPQDVAAEIVANDKQTKQNDVVAQQELEKKHAAQLEIRRRRDAFLQSLRSSKTILILKTNNRRIAMIGERKIAVGDVLPEGFRVSGINDRGLILDEIEVDGSQHGGSGNGEKEQ